MDINQVTQSETPEPMFKISVPDYSISPSTSFWSKVWVRIVSVAVILGLVGWGIFSYVALNQQFLAAEASLNTVNSYLTLGIQLGVFPTGQQLVSYQQQKANPQPTTLTPTSTIPSK